MIRRDVALSVVCASALAAGDVFACGGCFHPPPDPTRSVQRGASVVTNHRMVLSLSTTETTLWDQISWAGAPEDFVWALPLSNVRAARVAVSDDAFINGLDRATAPTIVASLPARCVRDRVTGALTMQPPSAREEVRLAVRPIVRARDPDAPSPDAPAVIPEATVGPYQTLLLDGVSAGQRLGEWLTANGYAIPAGGAAAVAHYTELNAGWIVLRLRPGEGVTRMSPVRVTLDGYAPTLPLRMIASGAGDTLGVALFVASNGPMRARDALDLRVDPREVTWRSDDQGSNYDQLFAAALGDRSRPAWVTESIVPWTGASSADARRLVDAGGVITRLRTLAAPGTLGRDLVLEPSNATPFDGRIEARVIDTAGCPRSIGDGGVDASTVTLPSYEPLGCQCAAGRAQTPRGAIVAVFGLVAVALRRLTLRRGRPRARAPQARARGLRG